MKSTPNKSIVYKKQVSCPSCSEHATLEQWSPVKRPALMIVRVFCKCGYFNLDTKTLLNFERSRSRSTVTLLADSRPVPQTLDGSFLSFDQSDSKKSLLKFFASRGF